MKLNRREEGATTSYNTDKPPLYHLCRFGYVAYKLILKDLRLDTKVGTRAKRYIYNATGIWCLWDMESGRIIKFSGVRLDEHSTACSENPCNGGHDPLGADMWRISSWSL